MRSEHVDHFNHDDQADGYDEEVRDEENPIRAKYEEVLDWVAAVAGILPTSRVLELGSGTGNLTRRLPPSREIVCVDISERMEEVAGSSDERVASGSRSFVKDDALAVFDRGLGRFDAIVSTYTIHHLTEPEKAALFERLWSHLNAGGTAAFGDLMVESADAEAQLITTCRAGGREAIAAALEEEFFWRLDVSLARLREVGFAVEWKRFSELSLGIVARKDRR